MKVYTGKNCLFGQFAKVCTYKIKILQILVLEKFLFGKVSMSEVMPKKVTLNALGFMGFVLEVAS